MYGVDGFWGAEEDGGDPLAWAEERWKDDGVENAGALYDQHEMFHEFCACVDSCCSGPSLHDVEISMCGGCKVDDEVKFGIGVDADCDSNMFDFVCEIDDTEDDEFVTTDYKGLRDVDGRQRRDPWGGSSTSVPKRVSMTIAPTHIEGPTACAAVFVFVCMVLVVAMFCDFRLCFVWHV